MAFNIYKKDLPSWHTSYKAGSTELSDLNNLAARAALGPDDITTNGDYKYEYIDTWYDEYDEPYEVTLTRTYLKKSGLKYGGYCFDKYKINSTDGIVIAGTEILGSGLQNLSNLVPDDYPYDTTDDIHGQYLGNDTIHPPGGNTGSKFEKSIILKFSKESRSLDVFYDGRSDIPMIHSSNCPYLVYFEITAGGGAGGGLYSETYANGGGGGGCGLAGYFDFTKCSEIEITLGRGGLNSSTASERNGTPSKIKLIDGPLAGGEISIAGGAGGYRNSNGSYGGAGGSVATFTTSGGKSSTLTNESFAGGSNGGIFVIKVVSGKSGGKAGVNGTSMPDNSIRCTNSTTNPDYGIITVPARSGGESPAQDSSTYPYPQSGGGGGASLHGAGTAGRRSTREDGPNQNYNDWTNHAVAGGGGGGCGKTEASEDFAGGTVTPSGSGLLGGNGRLRLSL